MRVMYIMITDYEISDVGKITLFLWVREGCGGGGVRKLHSLNLYGITSLGIPYTLSHVGIVR